MKKLTLITILFYSAIFAQKTKFEGRPKVKISVKVVEVKSKIPLEYATIVLTNKKSKKLFGGVTDAKGFFYTDIPKGFYNIKVEYIGFETKKLPSQKIFENKNFGIINLKEDNQQLDEVEIIAEKSTIRIKLDKKIYNVGKDMTVKGGNASDVLDNVPSVNVDSDGTVSLRGNENVRILIDGKPSSLVGLSGADALRNLPADAIKKVEVVTSASARYDAEGTAGILNIILRKGKIKGFNGSTSLTTGMPENYRLATNMNYRTKKLNVFSNIGLSYRKPNGNSNFSSTNYNNKIVTSYQKQKRESDRKRKGFTPSIGLEYFINDKSSITGQFIYKKSIGENENTNISSFYDSSKVFLGSSIRVQEENKDEYALQYSLNYTNNIDSNGQKLNIDLQHSTAKEDDFTDIFSDNVISEKNFQLTNAKSFLFQMNYILPLRKKEQLELGHKIDLNDVNSDFKIRKGDGTIPLYDTSNEVNFYQIIYAYYAQYGKKINNFSYLLGLRGEKTELDLELLNTNQSSKKDYFKLFPTMNLGFEFNKKSNLTLGYSKRLRRPRRRFLNPFERRTSNTFIFKGNPDLDPTYTNAFELGYSSKIKKLFINSSIYYKHSTQNIQVLSRLEDRLDINTNQTITAEVHQPYNINNENRYGFELNTSYTPIKWLRLSGAFNYFNYKTNSFTYNYIYNGTTYNKDFSTVESSSWFMRFNAKVKLPAKIDWQTRFKYRAPRKTAQSDYKSSYSLNLSFSKDFFKEKVTLTFNASDILNSKRMRKTAFNTDRDNPRSISELNFQWRPRSFTLNFTYRFNQKKKKGRPKGGYNSSGESGF